VPKSIGGETTMKMRHNEVGICRRYGLHKEMCIKGEIKIVTLRTFRFKIQYINKICVQYEKGTRESHVPILKRLHLSDISCGI
jgi:hypothetical protein